MGDRFAEAILRAAAKTSGGLAAAMTAQSVARWKGVLTFEAVETGDRRMFAEGALTWEIPEEGLPLFLMLRNPDGGSGHDGAIAAVGRITNITRGEASDAGIPILGVGEFDMESEGGREAARLVSEGWMRGVSVDVDSVDVELVFPPEEFEGNLIDDDLPRDEDGNVVLKVSQPLVRFTRGRIRGATITAMPAFADARIEPDDEPLTYVAASAVPADDLGTAWAVTMPVTGDSWVATQGEEPELCEPCIQEALVAAAAARPRSVQSVTTFPPPAEWFAMPTPAELAALRAGSPAKVVTPDGRVYGYAAAWKSCHTGFAGRCVRPPRSMCGYRKFHVGSVLCADGTMVATGPLVLGGEHAPTNRRLGEAEVRDFYASTSFAVADVTMHEDDYGLIFAGAVRPDATPEQVAALRASDVSPDWRWFDDVGNLEQLALLAVNASGYVPEGRGALAASAMQVGWDLSQEQPYALVAGTAFSMGTPARLAVDGDRVAELERLVQRADQNARTALQLLESLVSAAIEDQRDEALAALGELPTAEERRRALLASIGVEDPEVERDRLLSQVLADPVA